MVVISPAIAFLRIGRVVVVVDFVVVVVFVVVGGGDGIVVF